MRRIWVILILLLFWASLAHARQDAANEQWFKDHSLPVLWDNIESKPEWIAGEKPTRQWGERLHQINLRPGEWTVVAVPPDQWLRLVSPESGEALDTISVMRSVDGTSFIDEDLSIIPVDADRLQALTTSRRSLMSWVRVANRSSASRSVVLALFTSRLAEPGTNYDYHYTLKPSNTVTSVRLSDKPGSEIYWPLYKEQSLHYEVHGPQRIQIQSRLQLHEHLRSSYEPYQINASIDGKTVALLELESGDERHRMVRINHCVSPVARTQRAYLDIPAGEHRLSLSSHASLFVKLEASRAERDYLFDRNAPRKWIGRNAQTESLWDNDPDMMPFLLDPESPLSVQEPAAQRLIRDNGYLPDSLTARERMGGRNNYQQETLMRAHMLKNSVASLRHWIDLLPDINSATIQQHVLTLAPQNLSSADEDLFLWRNQIPKLAQQQIQGRLIRFKNSGDSYRYQLTQNQSERRLRIYLLAKHAEDTHFLTLQMGNAAGRNLQVMKLDSSSNVQPQVSAADLAASILYKDIMPAGFKPYWVEVTVPAGVDNIRLTSQRAGLWVASRLEQSIGYVPSERDYLGALSAGNRNDVQSDFLESLKWIHQHGDLQKMPSGKLGRELINQWWPLLRYLKLQRRYFPATREQKPLTAIATQGNVDVSRYINNAQAAEKNQDYIQAIEHWSHAIEGSQGLEQDNLRLQRARILLKQGSEFDANREWWNLYLYSQYPIMREKALEAIIDQAKQGEDHERVVRVLSAALLEKPSVALLSRLLPALVAIGETKKALYIGLLLDPDKRPTEPLLLSAASEGWWQVFDQLHSDLVDVESRRYWSGIKNTAMGQYEKALESWQDNNERSQQANTWLKKALSIRDGLSSSRIEQRQQALRSWSSWMTQGLLYAKWRDSNEYVTSFAGSERLSIPELGLQQDQYLSTSSRPLRLRVHGPQLIKLLIRPLHPASHNGALDDWVIIRNGDQVLRVPVTRNLVDKERHLLGKPAAKVGLRVVQTLQLAPGVNTLEVQLLQQDAIINVQVSQSVIPTPVLPQREYSSLQNWIDMDISGRDKVIDSSTMTALGLLGDCAHSSRNVAVMTLPPELNELGKVGELSKSSLSSSQALIDPLLKRLLDLIWAMEQTPDDRVKLTLQAHQLLDDNPENKALQKYAGRASRYVNWKALNTLERRAGIKRIELQKVNPEHPSARLNYALLSPLANHQQRLHGWGELLLTLEQARSLQLRFDFELEALRVSGDSSLQLTVQRDTKKRHTLYFSEQKRRDSLKLKVASGAHSVRLSLVNPYAGQNIKVSVYEKLANGTWVPHALEEQSRMYHVATHAEPLVMHAKGPNRLRIDEWLDGVIHTHYRDIKAGWQPVRLTPQGRQKEALYKIFEMAANDLPRPIPSLVPDTGLPTLTHLLKPRMSPVTPEGKPRDQLKLGGQEDGTWSLTLAPTSRRNFDEDDDSLDEAEVFSEWRISHRKFIEHAELYHHEDVLLRTREYGDPTLGLRQKISRKNIWKQTDLDAQASLYLQQPNSNHGTEWAVDFRARLSRHYDINSWLGHRPGITAFARGLSMDGLPVTNSRDVDQDIFTRYKRQHLYGLKVCDDLTYGPWVDTRMLASACVTSNEDLNLFDPDNFSVRLGARSLVGDLLLKADFRETWYFRDADRRTHSTRQNLRLEVDFLRWQTARNGFQVGLRAEHDFKLSDNSVWLTFTWHHANGRLFRDFRPEELSFRHLRQRLHNDRLYPSGQGVAP